AEAVREVAYHALALGDGRPLADTVVSWIRQGAEHWPTLLEELAEAPQAPQQLPALPGGAPPAAERTPFGWWPLISRARQIAADRAIAAAGAPAPASGAAPPSA